MFVLRYFKLQSIQSVNKALIDLLLHTVDFLLAISYLLLLHTLINL